jgi:hypothetical protein
MSLVFPIGRFRCTMRHCTSECNACSFLSLLAPIHFSVHMSASHSVVYIYICVTICIHTVRYLNIRIKVTKNVAKAIGPKLPEVPGSGSSAFVSRCSGTVWTPSPLMAWGPGAQGPGGARGWDDWGSHDARMVGGTFLMDARFRLK